MTQDPKTSGKAVSSHQAGVSPREAWSAHLLLSAHKAQEAGFTHFAQALLDLYQLALQREQLTSGLPSRA